ncbi:MAG: magnesium-translocating P-type ATPase [Candidatus Nanoarchaeia archaeon]|nr:magnesium-translocating P-type ATPase [Candidatus Haiyanarchaeum thermophilum]MCW1303057.1 magnesium-translocating P-type ATPase [Candidatus Haiyanarchaeum thermophilum]MCW1303722.1 magnesium-translocating P-type ATPase [Candidatus Haiyanarchaeum thermophilum]MCW1306833.1 magnesium-translocating P-type ATPase [Candidatus Haiyanarchaeum thermophilum]MCW1307075.1 magnesium-translocating P-type ATPase [Candidatus Haiyanarchaeum thermophilum]
MKVELAWKKSVEEVIKELNSSPKGLSKEEAKRRFREFGENDVPRRKERGKLSLLLSQFRNPLVMVLICVAILSFLTGGELEAITVIGIVLINALVGFVQEHKSEEALSKLCRYITYTAKVIRDDEIIEIDSREIVPGDIVVIESGDRVPADLRLIEVNELEMDESIITGEAFPVEKNVAPIQTEKLEAKEMKNMAFMGTIVASGSGKGIVVATGMDTMFGEIVGYLKAEEPKTSYEENIKNFSNFLVKLILIGTIFIFLVNFIILRELVEVLLFSIALAVAVTPEALPVIITICLSQGAVRMSRLGIFVKRLSAIEDLGDMDVICFDKTGTITENLIQLVDFFDLNERRNLEVLELARACISVRKTGKRLSGNPLDLAIYNYSEVKVMREFEVIEQIPFDFERKRMSSVIKEKGKLWLVTKGEPRSVISACTYMLWEGKIEKIDRERAISLFEKKSAEGYRVLALAFKSIPYKQNYEKSDEHDLILLGFLCFTDKLKKDVGEFVKRLEKLGVKIKILTGDNEIVSQKVARDAGIEVRGVITGAQIDAMSEDELIEAVERANLFTGLSPKQKVRIVEALKKRGHTVGFLGDGVNDAPVLRFSDVGISVSSGVDVAKEASDIVLNRKSLKDILNGIIEGRKTFANTTKYILNTVSANIGNTITLALVSPFLGFLAMLPAQILLTNLLSDCPLLAISIDNVDEDELRAPKKWNLAFISKFVLLFGAVSSVFDLVLILSFNFFLKVSESLLRTIWFVYSTLSEIAVTFVIRTRKPFFKSRPSKILLLTSTIFSIITLLVIFPPMANWFEFSTLNSQHISLLFLVIFLYFITEEVAKLLFFARSQA